MRYVSCIVRFDARNTASKNERRNEHIIVLWNLFLKSRFLFSIRFSPFYSSDRCVCVWGVGQATQCQLAPGGLCALRTKMNWHKKRNLALSSDQRLNHLPKLCFVEFWFRIENEAIPLFNSIKSFYIFYLFELLLLLVHGRCRSMSESTMICTIAIIWESKECFKWCVITVNNVILIG